MTPISSTNKPLAIASSSFSTQTKTQIEYTNTGFGQLPVPKTVTRHKISFRPTRSQTTLTLTAFVLALFGVIYLLIYVTITYTKK